MDKKTLREMRELDEAAEKAGGYLAPFNNKNTHYNYRKISDYCKKRNIEPQDMTLRELRQFIEQD